MDNPAGKRTGAVVGTSGLDFVQTPRIAVEKLLGVESFDGRIWEPACGKGAISRVLLGRGLQVTSSDIVDRGYRDRTYNFDFLREPGSQVPNIITNPPFKLLVEFIEQGLRLAQHKLVLFTRFSALAGSKRRIDIFRRHRPTQVWGFYGKIPYVNADDVEIPSAMDFAWVVWDMTRPATTTALDWL